MLPLYKLGAAKGFLYPKIRDVPFLKELDRLLPNPSDALPEIDRESRIQLSASDGRGEFDISCGRHLVCRPHALDVIRPILPPESIVISFLDEKDAELFVIVEELVDCIDESMSECMRYSDGRIIDSFDLTLFGDRIQNVHLFRLPMIAPYPVVSDAFRDAVEGAGLSGCVFIALDCALS